MSDCSFMKMVKKCDAFDKLMQGNGYVSCIKINGNPILPPLVTAERRLELENDKKRAVDLERRLKCQKDLKTFINKLDYSNLQIGKNVKNRTLEHILAFEDQSHIDAFNISNISNNDDNQSKLPSSNDYKEIKVPLDTKREKNHKSFNLTCNIFDVTEYSANGIVVFNNEINKINVVDKLSASTVELDLSSDCASKSNLDDIEVFQPKPRLRSNSYTLESPSPVLLEHLKNKAKHDRNNSCTFEEQTNAKRRSFDLGKSIRNWSFEDFKSRTFDSESEINKEYSEKCLVDLNGSTSSGIVADIGSVRDECDENNPSGCDLTSIQTVVENLAEKHFGPIKASKKTDTVHDVQCNNTIIDDDKLMSFDVTKDNLDLFCLDENNLELQGLPESYIKDIIEFLEQHRNEQEIKLRLIRDELNKSNNNEQLKNQKPIGNIENNDDKPEQLNEVMKLLCCDNVDVTSNPLDTSTPRLIEFESDSCDNEPLIYYDSNSSFANSEPVHTSSHYEYHDYQKDLSSTANCSRELFPEDHKKLQRRLKQEWAGTILTAAAKGYLVRRLKRTERVRSLIQTIQEALLCAMSLHKENSENIRPPDVELHRRLIQQVSAACFEFYEIFFTLTTKEKMAVIALDRQRLQEKLNRPKSVSSVRLSSGRSSVKSRQSFNTKQKKSLTPTFAA